MKKYYPLEKIFHMNGNSEAEYKTRINSPASYITNLYINPFIKGKKENKLYSLFIVNSVELTNILGKVYVNSNKIISKQNSLPKTAREKFFNLLLINELQSTNEIESVNSSKREISEALLISKKNANKPNLKRFLGLVSLYSHINKQNEISSPKDYRKIYDILVNEEINDDDKLDGTIFRKKGVGIYSGNDIVHRGLSTEEEIINSLQNLITFSKNEDIPLVYTALISHYYFEYIHPFYDGNGRVGRFLLADLLSKAIDEYTAITFSYSINRNKNKYYSSFSRTSNPLNKGEITFFVKENLEILLNGQQHVLSFLDENIKKLETAHNYLEENIFDPILKNILFILVQSHLFSAKDDLITHSELAEILQISPRTLNKYLLENKEKIEILKKKPKIYTLHSDFLDLLFSED